MSNIVWKTCKSKKRYRDEHDANFYKKKHSREYGLRFDYYWCPYCTGFHLTSKIDC